MKMKSQVRGWYEVCSYFMDWFCEYFRSFLGWQKGLVPCLVFFCCYSSRNGYVMANGDFYTSFKKRRQNWGEAEIRVIIYYKIGNNWDLENTWRQSEGEGHTKEPQFARGLIQACLTRTEGIVRFILLHYSMQTSSLPAGNNLNSGGTSNHFQFSSLNSFSWDILTKHLGSNKVTLNIWEPTSKQNNLLNTMQPRQRN